MAKFRTQPFLGLVVGAFFGFVAGACSYGAINQDAIVVVCFVLGGALGGLALGLKFNPTVSVYWPWLISVFGIGFVPTFGMMMASYYQTPPGLRDEALYKYTPFLIGAWIAAAVAMIAAIVHHAKRLARGEKDDASNFSLATILLVLGGASVAFGLLRWIDASAVFFYIVVIFILGRFACLFVNAILSKRKKTLSHPATSPEKEYSGNASPENTPD
jgi:hypothetical protein